MARRSGGTHKGVEEKRRSLPIYHHYTLSPGKTKSHHPEAKCNHCLKEFVCGSKQRLIRHLRKCNSISNPEQIIAETLNALTRNSATGQLNHSILEASNLLPSQQHHLHHQQQGTHHQTVNHQIHHSTTTANSSIINNSNNVSNHNTSGSSSNDTAAAAGNLVASGSNDGSQVQLLTNATPAKRPQRRGRKPANQLANASPSIHVTTGIDGKTHFTPASQLPSTISGTIGTPMIAQVHNGGRSVSYAYHPGALSTVNAATPISTPGVHLSANSGHLACTTPNHHSTAYKLNSDHIDKAYLKLVLTRNLPLSLCDTKEFQIWVKTFANDYKPPSSINLIAQNLRNEAQMAKQRVSNILVKAPKKTINLELHCWHDMLRDHLWYAVVANVDLKRFLVSVKDIYEQLPSVNNSTNNVTNSGSNIHNGNNNNNSATTLHQNNNLTVSDTKLSDFIDECIKRVGSDRINSLVFSGSIREDTRASRTRQSLYTTHPSIVTYYCWWHFTNLLCSDIIEHNGIFQNVMRNSNRLIDFVNKRPRIGLSLEKFSPFAGLLGSINQTKNDQRWYSHLVCYLLEYIKNNNEAIIRALEAYSSPQSHLSSDNNNNSSGSSNNTQATSGIQQSSANTLSTQQQQQQNILGHEDALKNEIKSIFLSSEYWTNLDSVLAYLKPIQEIVALTSTVSAATHNQHQNHNNNNNTNNTNSSINTPTTAGSPPSSSSVHQQYTPSYSSSLANKFSMSEYMNWFLNYGKSLFESWRQSPDSFKYQLIGRYLSRFNSNFSEFKLLFAAYLLNPKHRCAYMTQVAKNTAIEEILNVASEFMPEESDGHTIFDQWRLYLVREEPYDMVFEENRSTPLEWWMSLPCAESIRRVALRILRLKAFTSSKPETLFSQLYFYEDEMKTSLTSTSFEDIAILRYFYDYEDKIGQINAHSSSHNHSSHSNNLNASNSFSSNGYHDRTQAGQIHNHLQQSNSTKFLPSGGLDVPTDMINGQVNELSMNDVKSSAGFVDTFSDVVVDPYMNHHNSHLNSLDGTQGDLGATSTHSIQDLPGYDIFVRYVDYNDLGVQIVEEPIEKKKKRWTAQEILSRRQSNHQSNNNNDISSK